MYMFYKNALLVLPQWLLGIYGMYTGQNFYVEYPLYQLSNMAYSAFPIIIFGVFDQDVISEVPARVPELYQDGSVFGIHFSHKRFWSWMFEATWSAAVCFLIPMWTMGQAGPTGHPAVVNQEGRNSDLWAIGTVVHLSVTLVQNVRLALEVRTWNWLTWGGFIFSILAWFVTVAIFARWGSLTYGLASAEAYGLDSQVLGDPASWCAVMLAVVVSVLPAGLAKVLRMLYKPPLFQIAGELQKRFYRDIRPTKETWCCVDESRTAAAEADAAADSNTGIEMRSSEQKDKEYDNPPVEHAGSPQVSAADQAFADLCKKLQLDMVRCASHVLATAYGR